MNDHIKAVRAFVRSRGTYSSSVWRWVTRDKNGHIDAFKRQPHIPDFKDGTWRCYSDRGTTERLTLRFADEVAQFPSPLDDIPWDLSLTYIGDEFDGV